MKLSDMQKKDIVFLKDGKKIGRIVDAEVETETGRITNLFVEKKNIKFMFNSEFMDVNFHHIKKIGEDVILIDD